MHKTIVILILILFAQSTKAQKENERNNELDSLFISEVENQNYPDKVLHAEPLFIDLIRDLGARKGEQEWNLGIGLTDRGDFDQYTTLVEYEWAPVNRLGLEFELPFSLYYPTQNNVSQSAPNNALNSVKMAAQYSFYVSEKNKASMAVGGIHELLLTEFATYNKEKIYKGNVYNPFFIAAKRWGNNFHTLLYTGPVLEKLLVQNGVHTTWQINSNIHYMLPGTRNFIGVEVNKTLEKNDFDMTIRPQMRLGVTDQLLIGIVTGIPISRENERLSTFFRFIYEPKHTKQKSPTPSTKQK